MAQQTNNRDAGLDMVRTVAIIYVVIIHVAANSLVAGVGSLNWWGSLFWGALARPAVPLFFLCTGALMLGRDIPLKRLYGHNMLRVVLAMLAWAFGYQLVALFPDRLNPAGLWIAVKNTLTLNHEFHLYFLHILILVYAFLPVARVFVRAASRRELEYLLAFWFVTGILFPLIYNMWPFSLIPDIQSRYMMNMAYSAIGYGVLGWYLKRYGSSIPPIWYWLALAAGFAVTFAGTAVFSLRAGYLDERFLGGMTPGPALMAFGLFGLLANREQWPTPAAKASGRLALSAFCIYLVHILVIRVEMKLGLDVFASPSLIVIPLSVLAVVLPSHLCWEALRHIPIIKTWLI